MVIAVATMRAGGDGHRRWLVGIVGDGHHCRAVVRSVMGIAAGGGQSLARESASMT
jgi:hypothetical protein